MYRRIIEREVRFSLGTHRTFNYLSNSAGQGNCNIDAWSQTHDRWCYVRTKGHLNPWKVCPDAKESKVHHGRYWIYEKYMLTHHVVT